MTDNKPTYIEGIGWRYETLHNMHRRMQGHDYRERCIYMITMATEGRKPLLGTLRWTQDKPEEAWVEPSELGQEVERCWLSVKNYYPGVVPLALQLMPDHLHGLLFVTREQTAHLGQMVKGFKIGCSKAYWQQLDGAGLSVASYNSPNQTSPNQTSPNQTSPNQTSPNQTSSNQTSPNQTSPNQTSPNQTSSNQTSPNQTSKRRSLFEPGYQDSILMGKGQLNRMFSYIADNPKRLAVKREKPDLFRVVRELKVEGMTFAAIGNGWLLQRTDRMQVRCHNNQTPENLRLIERQKTYFLDRGKKGGVVVSPCISAGEKEIARAALDAGVPLVVILENGFPKMYKPPGKYFEACANGLLLMLAPWPYHMERRTITRQQCLALNDMAYRLSTEPWTQELEAKLSI